MPLTSQQVVSLLFPNSHCVRSEEENDFEIWCEVSPDLYEVLGIGLSPEEAWENTVTPAQTWANS